MNKTTLKEANKVNKMAKKKLLLLPVLLLFVLSVLTVNTPRVSAVEYPLIYIDPAPILDPTLTLGQRFTVSIKTDYEGTDIWGYQFSLTYNPSVLNGVEVTNGDLITEARHPSAKCMLGTFNNAAGTLSGTFCRFFFTAPEPAPLTYGPGTLANVTFEVVGTGTSNITLGPHTSLIGFTEEGYGLPYHIIDAETMPNHIKHGFFSNLHTIYVDPATTLDTTLTPGENYTISIKTNYNGTDIWGYEFTLTYKPSVLNGVEVTNGDLITEAVAPITWMPGTFNNTLGKLSWAGARFEFTTPPAPVTFGPGILANVTFTVVGKGDSDIILGTETVAPSRLIGIDEFGEPYNIIDDTLPDRIYHGYFDNTLHDIAVTNVTAPPEPVKIGEQASINVTVTNEGDCNETFTVIVYVDMNTTIIGDEITLETQTVDTWIGDGATTTFTTTRKPVVPDSEEVYVNETHIIRDVDYTVDYTTGNITFTTAPGEGVEVKATYLYNINLTAKNSTTLTFNWNTTDVRSGIYNVTAIASRVFGEKTGRVVLGEKNTTNNIGWTIVILVGPPVASFTYSPEEPVVNEVVTFNASASYDPDPEGAIVSYEWDFGDGNITSVDYPAITHVYTTTGTYTANLTVTDLEDKTDTTTRKITIGKLSSNITISVSLTTIALGENTTISGSLTPTRVNAIVTIWYRLGGETWNTANTANVTTNEESQYSYPWTPATDGTYELKASWQGDANTHPAESSTITVEVIKIHDIAVTNVTASPDMVKIGEQVSINVTVTNQGHYLETFNVTVYANTTLIDTLVDVILTSGGSTTFTITWDTAGTAKGDYTIKANASIVEGETDTDYNTYTDDVVTVQEAPPPDILLYAVVAAVAIIVIVAIAVYTLKLRKTKPT